MDSLSRCGDSGEGLACCLDRAVDVLVRMRTAHEERLELGRREVDALLNASWSEAQESS